MHKVHISARQYKPPDPCLVEIHQKMHDDGYLLASIITTRTGLAGPGFHDAALDGHSESVFCSLPVSASLNQALGFYNSANAAWRVAHSIAPPTPAP